MNICGDVNVPGLAICVPERSRSGLTCSFALDVPDVLDKGVRTEAHG